MTAIIQEMTENERLARVEAIVEVLVSEVSDLRAAERAHFLWLVGIIAPTLLGLLVSLIVLILTLQ